MLKALVRRQRVLGSIPAVAELTYVEGIRLLVLILEMTLQGVVA